MKYEMPAMTDAQRNSISNWLSGRIQSLNDKETSQEGGLTAGQFFQRTSYGIALAALTAESKTVRIFGAIGADTPCWLECDEGEDGATKHYTAPPVPALKFPDEMNMSDAVKSNITTDCMDFYNMAIAETKRRNGVE